MFSLK